MQSAMIRSSAMLKAKVSTAGRVRFVALLYSPSYLLLVTFTYGNPN